MFYLNSKKMWTPTIKIILHLDINFYRGSDHFWAHLFRERNGQIHALMWQRDRKKKKCIITLLRLWPHQLCCIFAYTYSFAVFPESPMNVCHVLILDFKEDVPLYFQPHFWIQASWREPICHTEWSSCCWQITSKHQSSLVSWTVQNLHVFTLHSIIQSNY